MYWVSVFLLFASFFGAAAGCEGGVALPGGAPPSPFTAAADVERFEMGAELPPAAGGVSAGFGTTLAQTIFLLACGATAPQGAVLGALVNVALLAGEAALGVPVAAAPHGAHNEALLAVEAALGMPVAAPHGAPAAGTAARKDKNNTVISDSQSLVLWRADLCAPRPTPGQRSIDEAALEVPGADEGNCVEWKAQDARMGGGPMGLILGAPAPTRAKNTFALLIALVVATAARICGAQNVACSAVGTYAGSGFGAFADGTGAGASPTWPCGVHVAYNAHTPCFDVTVPMAASSAWSSPPHLVSLVFAVTALVLAAAARGARWRSMQPRLGAAARWALLVAPFVG
jgi:hypothetical protein